MEVIVLSGILFELKKAILEFDAENIGRMTSEALNKASAEVIINHLSKTMEIVGEKYENGEYFLGDLIMAGETMKESLKVLDPILEKRGTEVSRPTVVIGTVEGDIHDIGKNIVAAMLIGANFEVIDLGVDVPSAKFVSTLKETGATILAMSALLSTTISGMKRVIEDLETEGLRKKVKVIVGGAAVTETFASEVGADRRGEDCVEAVRICNEMVGRN